MKKKQRASGAQNQGNSSTPRNPSVGVWIVSAIAVLALGVWSYKRSSTSAAPATAYHPRPPGTITFNKHIAPIVYRNCAGCHHESGPGAFKLVSYEEVRKHASDIVSVTKRRYMPPWLPEHTGPALADERRLTPEEIGLIQQWVAEGALEGDGSDSLPTPPPVQEWQLGKPDLIVELPQAYTLRADGKDVYRNFVIPLDQSERRYVRAMEFKPNSKAIHHIFVKFDRTHRSRKLDAEDAEIGFGGMSPPPTVESPGGYFLSWQPGRGPTRSPEGLAWPLEPRSDLVLQAHMQPTGKQEPVKPQIAFYFTQTLPTNTPVKVGLGSFKLEIPPGVNDYTVEDSYELPVDAELLAVLPHAHYLAKEMHAFAVLPTGEKKPLLDINDWDFNWQSDFRFSTPVSLPRNTRLHMRFIYDNSDQNLRNPHQPPVLVRYGSQSTDEMAEMWFQLLTHSPSELQALLADYDKRLIREILDYNSMLLSQNTTNAHAHIQVAKALITMGRKQEAIDHLRRGLRADPSEEEGHYQLGVLLMDSDPALAQTAFQRAILINPENFQALNNLGLIFLHFKQFSEAGAAFEKALALSPNDPTILQNIDLLNRTRSAPTP